MTSVEQMLEIENDVLDRPRGSISKLLKRGSFVYLRPYRKAQLILAVTVVISVALHTSLPLSLKYLIDTALVPRDEQMLVLILAGIFVLFALYSLGGIVQAYVKAQISVALKRDLRLELFTHLQKVPISYFDHTQPGEITELFAHELLILRSALADLTVEGLKAVLTLIVTFAALVFLDWRLSIVVAIVLPLTILIPRWAIRRSAAADFDETSQDAKVAFAVQDSVAAQPLIRAFGLHDYAVARFAQLIGSVDDEENSRLAHLKKGLNASPFLRSMVVVWTDIQQIALNGLTICVGAYLTWRGLLSIGSFSAFIVLLPRIGASITSLSGFFRDLISASSALERIDQVFQIPSERSERGDAVPLPSISQEIRFENVSFGYPGQPLQLRDVSFVLPARRSVAFVGRSGAGKSTILKLLLRFYDPVEGQVLLDGYDLRTVSQASFRAQVGVVLQEAPLLNTTIRENICLVNPEANDAELESAARLAEIHDTITRLPRGYETLVGEGGKLLSPGQRQRVALARALLHNPTLLLLDEITSALDLETEAAINDTLRKLARERTVIIVTHRLSSVVHADQVVVIDNGQVIEQGAPSELLRNKGFYRQLWQLQTGFIISANGQYAEVTGARLRFIPLFERLDDHTREMLADQFVSEYYDADQTIITEDSPGEKFYIIVRGKVSVSHTVPTSEESITLAVLEDGDYFGEIALIKGGLRSATVQTLLPSLFLTLERERFQKMMADIPTLQEVVEKTAQQRSLETITVVGRYTSSISM